ncbi:DUF6443 domain-containing protein [Winogradskyella sp.]|uniref:DUF6443 domain-containing protein n=1 Tax=Winogradskyella sp. TaxID=1883156 RepID=UPI003AB27947
MTNHKNILFFKIGLGLLMLVIFSTESIAQNLIGPTNVQANAIETYIYNDGVAWNLESWQVTNGNVISTSESGTSFTATIQWTSVGSASISFYDKTYLKGTLAVTVQQEADPPTVVTELNYVHSLAPRIPTTDTELLGANDKIESITYIDGLGRPAQQVAIRAGGNSEDIITHIAYDEFGRNAKEYLPYSSTADIGSYRIDALSDTYTFYDAAKYETDFPSMLPVNDINPYSEKEFDNSPLNRVMKQAAPGEDWKMGNGHEIKMNYQTNMATEVRRYEVALSFANNTYTPTLSLNTAPNNNNGYYAANELYKTIIKDENHDGTSSKAHTTEEFKDKQGRVILKRTYGTSKVDGVIETNVEHDTYYVYDDYGNLTYVLPPKAEPHEEQPDLIELIELCYQYKYDNLNRLVEKKIPGKGWEYIVYNKLDQPIMTQDANLRLNNGWLFTNYDVFGRVAYTGYTSHSLFTRHYLQNKANIETNLYVTKQTSNNTVAGTTIYYDEIGFPIEEIYTINYYDDYNFDKVSGNPESAYGITPETNVKGLATGSKVKVLETSGWITTVSYYDEKARPIYVYSHNTTLGTTDKVKSELTFDGLVKESTTTHNRDQFYKTTTVTIIDKYEYDHANRLLSHKQKINNAALDEVIAENTYDNLGQLIGKGVGGKQNVATRLQDVDYNYNIRGWLKTINDPSSIGTDLFAFKINYNTKDHSGNELYNGNISETEWRTKNDNILRWYRYDYDALNRITSGIASNNDYSLSSVDYDKNGNITNLSREGHINAQATLFDTMDNLEYFYENKSNRLKKVLDYGNEMYGFNDNSNITTEYTYDSNGNMLRDYNKGITSNIIYNHLNLPTQILLSDGNIQYIYDATGIKQKKIVSTGTSTEYAGNFIYENGYLKMFSHPEGYVDVSNATVYNPPFGGPPLSSRSSYNYVYQYKDHLGNIRLSYADSDGNGSIDASTEIIEESNYYPFGLEHKGYNNVVSANANSVAQKFKYNGKELSDELGLDWYDYGSRNYDVALGRWMNLDPLAESMVNNSPYNYAFNNPTFYIDPDGNAPMASEANCCGNRGMDEAARNGNKDAQRQIKTEQAGGRSFFSTLYGTVKGTVNAVLHPVETTKAVYHAITNPKETLTKVKADVVKTVNDAGSDDPEVSGSAIGKMGAIGVEMVFGGKGTAALLDKLSDVASIGSKLDIGGGQTSKYSDALNIDPNASSGFKGTLDDFIEQTGGNVKFDNIIVDNPQFNFLEGASKVLNEGGSITVRGTMSNKYFNKIANGKADGFSVSNKKSISNDGFTRTDGNPIQGEMFEIKLTRQ